MPLLLAGIGGGGSILVQGSNFSEGIQDIAAGLKGDTKSTSVSPVIWTSILYILKGQIL